VSAPGTPPSSGAPATRGVIVVADEPLLRLGLTRAVEIIQARATPALVLHGAVDSARSAQKVMATMRSPVGVLVLDPPLRDVTLAGACSMLIQSQPAATVLVLLSSPDRLAVRLACRHGARGVYDTAIEVDQMQTVLGTLLDGSVSIQPSLVHFLLDGDTYEDSPGKNGPNLLTERELVAIQFLARGYTSKEIAVMTGATPKAIDLTIERAARRLGASHRSQAVAIAVKRRLIT